MDNQILRLLLSEDTTGIHLIILSFAGALLGEARREIDDNKEIILYKFAIYFLGSTFGGFLFGILFKGLFPSKNYIALIAAGGGGYAGADKTMNIIWKLIYKILPDKKDIQNEDHHNSE